MIKKEIRIFFTALMFFTRIPCPPSTDHSEVHLNRASKYFTLVGLMVGCMVAFAYWLFSLIFSNDIAILLSFIASVLITGAFHEDGFADVCDGFGGGWTKEKILHIMKDSQIGTYGAVGLLLIFGLKYLTLLHINQPILTIISAHAISRLTAVSFIYTQSYAREDLLSKAKPLATQMSHQDFAIACIFGLAPLFLFKTYYVFGALVPLILLKMYFANYFKKWIGGYTGDCLGAVQQMAEVLFYLCMILFFNYL